MIFIGILIYELHISIKFRINYIVFLIYQILDN
jgi:hypothetical protein